MNGRLDAHVFQDERGRWFVRYRLPGWVAVYRADSQIDAQAFARSQERQLEDRRFAVAKWRLAKGRPS